MFKAILYTQWKWSKLVLLGAVVAVFALPILSVRSVTYAYDSPWLATIWIRSLQNWGIWYAALAAALGLIMATSVWASDHRGGHVYSLSLPVERWRFVLLRFGAGGVLMLPAVVCLWLGALVAVGIAEYPVGLRAYPTGLACRFGLAAFIAYSIFFAISSATARIAGVILVTIGGVIAATVLLAAAGINIDLFGMVFERILTWPGPLEIFTGRWTLIDV